MTDVAPAGQDDLSGAEAAEIARLNSDFNLRVRVPEFPSLLQRWEETAAQFRAAWVPRARFDLSYGPADLETLDLFWPEAPRPPVCIFLHPGSWQRLDKSLFSFIARPLLERGCATILANYPLVPAVRLGDIVESIERCLHWIMANAASLGLDGERLALFGHSSGGHLAAAIHARPGSFSAAERRRIRGVACVGGFYDLGAVRKSFMNDVLGLTTADVERLSPIAARDFMECELILAVGERETQEFHRQQNRMAAHVAACGHAVETLCLAGQDHFSLVLDLMQPGNPLIGRIASLLKNEAAAHKAAL